MKYKSLDLAGISKILRAHATQISPPGMSELKNVYLSRSDNSITMRPDFEQEVQDMAMAIGPNLEESDKREFLTAIYRLLDFDGYLYFSNQGPFSWENLVTTHLSDIYDTGTISTSGADNIVTGFGTQFLNFCWAGCLIRQKDTDALYRIIEIKSNLYLLTDPNMPQLTNEEFEIIRTYPAENGAWPMSFEKLGDIMVFNPAKPSLPVDTARISGPFYADVGSPELFGVWREYTPDVLTQVDELGAVHVGYALRPMFVCYAATSPRPLFAGGNNGFLLSCDGWDSVQALPVGTPGPSYNKTTATKSDGKEYTESYFSHSVRISGTGYPFNQQWGSPLDHKAKLTEDYYFAQDQGLLYTHFLKCGTLKSPLFTRIPTGVSSDVIGIEYDIGGTISVGFRDGTFISGTFDLNLTEVGHRPMTVTWGVNTYQMPGGDAFGCSVDLIYGRAGAHYSITGGAGVYATDGDLLDHCYGQGGIAAPQGFILVGGIDSTYSESVIINIEGDVTPSGVTEDLTGVCFMLAVNDGAVGRYVAVGTNGVSVISDDLSYTWTPVTTGIARDFKAVSSDVQGRCALAVGEEMLISVTEDGETWVELDPRTISASGILFDPPYISSSSSSSSYKYEYVENQNANWLQDPTKPPYYESGKSIEDVKFDDTSGEFVLSVFGSSDNRFYRIRRGYTFDHDDKKDEALAEIFPFGDKSDRHVAGCSTGTNLISVGNKIWTSSDQGETWVVRQDLKDSLQYLDVAHDGAGTVVAVGEHGKIYYSTNHGASWTAKYAAGGNAFMTSDEDSLNSVIWDGYNFIAVGGKETVIRTTGGNPASWTQMTFSFAEEMLMQVGWNGNYTLDPVTGLSYYGFQDNLFLIAKSGQMYVNTNNKNVATPAPVSPVYDEWERWETSADGSVGDLSPTTRLGKARFSIAGRQYFRTIAGRYQLAMVGRYGSSFDSQDIHNPGPRVFNSPRGALSLNYPAASNWAQFGTYYSETQDKYFSYSDFPRYDFVFHGGLQLEDGGAYKGFSCPIVVLLREDGTLHISSDAGVTWGPPTGIYYKYPGYQGKIYDRQLKIPTDKWVTLKAYSDVSKTSYAFDAFSPVSFFFDDDYIYLLLNQGYSTENEDTGTKHYAVCARIPRTDMKMGYYYPAGNNRIRELQTAESAADVSMTMTCDAAVITA
jgi:photosystem II stability/assembly factor-like uncharacterized protein